MKNTESSQRINSNTVDSSVGKTTRVKKFLTDFIKSRQNKGGGLIYGLSL